MIASRLQVFAFVVLGASAARAQAPQTLTLQQAIAELNANNLTLAQAQARADEAGGVVRQSLAALLPTLAAGGSYTRNNAEAKLSMNALLDSIEGGLSKLSPTPVRFDRTEVPNDALIQPLQAWTGQAALRVPLFVANGYADYQSARENEKAAQLSVESARQQLQAALEQSAIWSAAAEEMAAASEHALVVAQKHAQSAQAGVIAGTAGPLSELQARTEVVRRESEVVRAKAEVARTRLALGVLLGRAESVRVTVDAVRDVSGERDAQVAEALDHRPELKARLAGVDAAQQQVASAWWRLAPTLSASATGVVSDVTFVTGLNTGWKLSVDLSWVLYDGGFRYGKRTQAEAMLRGAQAARDAQSLEVRQQVLDARRDVEVAAERLTLVQKQAALAAEGAATAERGFQAGISSSLDVLDANDRQFQAEVALADARARVGMAAVVLAKARGALRP